MRQVDVRVLVVAAFVAVASGCKSDSPIDPLERASRITAASAVDIAGVVGTTAASAPAVRVTDEDGDPVSGAQVFFTVTAGSGSVNPSVAITDADGRATTAWTLGTTVQANTLKAVVGTLSPVVFTATTVAGPPTRLERFGADNQIVAVGSVVPSPLRVQVTDSFHNPVPGVAVSFSVVSGGGTIAPANAGSDAAGFVSATWTVGPTAGVQSAQAGFAGLSLLFTADTFSCVGAAAAAPCAGAGELIFIRSADNQIYRINVDGTGLTKLTSEGSHNDAAWSPEGKRIAFTRFASGSQSSDVYLMNADGSNVVRRTTGGQYYSVTWSPDGRSLTVDAPSGGDSLNVLTMSADGNGLPTVLITNAGSPSWSPDGKQIAYSHGTAYYDASQIYVSNADGTGARRATPDFSGWNWNAAWSPDGKKLSFTRCLSTCGIYAMELSSSVLTLVPSAAGSQEAEWSPDGSWLALTLYGGNTSPSIHYLPASGGNPRMIFSGAFRPSWRPPMR